MSFCSEFKSFQSCTCVASVLSPPPPSPQLTDVYTRITGAAPADIPALQAACTHTHKNTQAHTQITRLLSFAHARSLGTDLKKTTAWKLVIDIAPPPRDVTFPVKQSKPVPTYWDLPLALAALGLGLERRCAARRLLRMPSGRPALSSNSGSQEKELNRLK